MKKMKTIGVVGCVLLSGLMYASAASAARETRLDEGFRLLNTGEVDAARKIFLGVITTKGGNPDALEGLATCLYLSGDYDRAQRTLNILLRRNKDSAFAHALMGNMAFIKQDYTAAEESLKKAVHLDPRRPSYQNNLGVIFLERGDHTAAAQHFRKALRYDARFTEAQYNLAVAQASGPRKNLRSARKYYKKALKGGFPEVPALEALLEQR